MPDPAASLRRRNLLIIVCSQVVVVVLLTMSFNEIGRRKKIPETTDLRFGYAARINQLKKTAAHRGWKKDERPGLGSRGRQVDRRGEAWRGSGNKNKAH